MRCGYPRLHRRDDWAPAQAFAGRAWAQGVPGILFRSVRRQGAVNVAVFRGELARAGTPMHIVGLRWEAGRLVQV